MIIDDLFNIQTAIIPLNDTIPYAYTSLYEKGDVWVRIRGCEDCLPENRKKCCGSCPMVSDAGCFFQLMSGRSQKPFSCIVSPVPSQAKSYCVLEFECIKGSNKGKIRQVRDKNGVLR